MSVHSIPPAVTDETAAFWAAAAADRLEVEACVACGRICFPPRGMCRWCGGRSVVPREVTATGSVYSFTVNHQRWLPDLDVPYAVVLVEWDDHPGLRVVGLLRGCPVEDVRIGMRVAVGFEDGPDGFRVPSFVAAP